MDKVTEHRGNKSNERSVCQIGNQVNFIGTIKYYQQSLVSLSASTDKLEEKNIRISCKSFFKKFNYFSDVYNSLADEEKAWVLKYLFAGKGVI